MIYRIGICDNNVNMCEQLEQFVQYFFNMHNCKVEVFVWYTGVGCCKSLTNDVSIDVLFLEINLPEKNGIEVGRYIREKLQNNIMHIIFMSEETDNAMNLFRIHPYDFLVKPITQQIISEIFSNLLIIDEQDQRFFTYMKRKSLNKIPYGKIQYFSSRNRHIEVHMTDGSIREFNGQLKNELERLPEQFVMIAQSYIINLKYVKECKYDHVVMQSNDVINISQPNRIKFREKMSMYNEGDMFKK